MGELFNLRFVLCTFVFEFLDLLCAQFHLTASLFLKLRQTKKPIHMDGVPAPGGQNSPKASQAIIHMYRHKNRDRAKHKQVRYSVVDTNTV